MKQAQRAMSLTVYSSAGPGTTMAYQTGGSVVAVLVTSLRHPCQTEAHLSEEGRVPGDRSLQRTKHFTCFKYSLYISTD